MARRYRNHAVYGGFSFRPYVSAGDRRRRAAQVVAKMRKSGHEPCPVHIEGRKIACTFWGESWCDNLEAYSDFANRLPRGRTYARNGSVIDLQITAGRVAALVYGSELYEVTIGIAPLPAERWATITAESAGTIDSVVELLAGKLSRGVMEIVTRTSEGLFPSPAEITLKCSCPDWATMCKHVAAVLYGVGARLDHAPELLFTLRDVDPTEMVVAATVAPGMRHSKGARILDDSDLADIFGIDIARASVEDRASRERARKKPKRKPAPKKKKAKKGERSAKGRNGLARLRSSGRDAR